MSGRPPTATVAAGRLVLTVGDSAGTLIEPGASRGDPAEIAAGLERPAVGTVAREAVDAVSAATARIEEAAGLFRAISDGRIDISEASGPLGAMLGLLEQLDREGHHRQAIDLARAVNGLLALALRWAELARTINLAAKAAAQLGDPGDAAWAEHELGTLRMAADDPAAAERHLAEAQRLRRELHDRDGLAATEQNLGALCRRLRELLREGRMEPQPRRISRASAAVVLLLVLLGGGAIGAAIARDERDPPAVDTTRLTVASEGPGRVTSRPAGIDCPERCDHDVERGTEIVLTARPTQDATFAGWSGACEDTGPCRLGMRRDRAVQARFREDTQDRARLQVEPPANGRITGPRGIDCGGACDADLALGAEVTLQAEPGAGFRFDAWGEDCAGRGNPCTLTMGGDRTASVAFAEQPAATVSITVTVSGEGTVTSEPPGIDCPGTCSDEFPVDEDPLVLTPDAAAPNTPVTWGADCAGATATCSLALDADHTAEVTFEPQEPVP
jgi:hypothetical protein